MKTAIRLLVAFLALTGGSHPVVAQQPDRGPPDRTDVARATSPAKGVAVDHVFIAIPAGDTAAFAALRRAGITVGARVHRHEGQGTASRTALLGSMYLELIWADTSVSLDPAATSFPTKQRDAAAWRASGPSPFGVGLRRGAEPVDYGVPVLRHSAEWMEPGSALEILTSADDPAVIDVFVVPQYMAMPAWLPMLESQAPELLRHPLGVRSVTAVRITSPARHRPAVFGTLAIPAFTFSPGDDLLLTLELDGAVRGERIDLRPALPLLLVR